MVIQQLREMLKAVPFEPFDLKMADGTVYRIRHQDFVSVSPKGRVIVWDKEDRAHHLNPLLILSVNEISAKKHT